MASKLRSAVCAPERAASDGQTAAVERGGPRQVYLRYTRPETASIAPTGRTSLRISNGLETAFDHLRTGETCIGRSEGGCRAGRPMASVLEAYTPRDRQHRANWAHYSTNKQWLLNCVPPFALRSGHGRTARQWRSNGTSGRFLLSSQIPKQPFEKKNAKGPLV